MNELKGCKKIDQDCVHGSLSAHPSVSYFVLLHSILSYHDCSLNTAAKHSY